MNSALNACQYEGIKRSHMTTLALLAYSHPILIHLNDMHHSIFVTLLKHNAGYSTILHCGIMQSQSVFNCPVHVWMLTVNWLTICWVEAEFIPHSAWFLLISCVVIVSNTAKALNCLNITVFAMGCMCWQWCRVFQFLCDRDNSQLHLLSECFF